MRGFATCCMVLCAIQIPPLFQKILNPGCQLGPRYEGQLTRMAEPIPPSGQSSSYSLTTLSSSSSTDRRAETDRIVITTRIAVAHHFRCRLRRRESCILGATSSQPTLPLHELPPARHRGRSRPLRSACRSRGRGSVSSGLTPTLREDWACKRALETPCHARIAPSPQDPTAMSPDHWSKLTWDTVSAGAMTSWSNRLLGPETRPCVQSESHSYSRHLITLS